MNSSDSSVQPKSDDQATDDTPELVFELTPEQVKALEALRASFTPDEIAEIEVRQRESDKLIAKLAATETLEEQQQLAADLCPEFDDWIRGRNRVRTAVRRAHVVSRSTSRTRASATPRERREHRTSRSSGQSPPDDPELPIEAGVAA